MKAKKKSKKYEQLWIKTRDLIRSISKNSDDYNEKHMKIEFDSNEKLPVNKTIGIPIVKIVIRAVFHENIKYYITTTFLDQYLYKINIL